MLERLVKTLYKKYSEDIILAWGKIKVRYFMLAILRFAITNRYSIIIFKIFLIISSNFFFVVTFKTNINAELRL